MRGASEIRGRRSVVIHPTAIVHPEAELGEDVKVGPFAIIEGTVKVGDRTIVGPRVSIEGHTSLGCDNELFTGAVIGSRTQDKKFDGGTSYLRIGDHNKIREYVTINPGTKDGTATEIGSHNLLMAYCHVAHDCIIHNNAILANAATLAGHVIVEDRAIIGGLSAVHQFVRLGRLSIVGGCSKVVQDVPPYVMSDGHPARAYGINGVGIDRAGHTSEDKTRLKKAFRLVFRSGLTLKNAIQRIESELMPCSTVSVLLEFLKLSDRGICR